MNGIELTDVGRKNLRRIIDQEFPLTIYCQRLERRWKPKFPTLFGDELQPSAVKKWMDSDVGCLKPQSVKALANHYFGGLFPEELEEWLNVDHYDIELAIDAVRKKAHERKQIQAQLNPGCQLDLSQVPTDILLGEIVVRFQLQQLHIPSLAGYSGSSFSPRLQEAQSMASCLSHSVGVLTESTQTKLMLTLSDGEKKILRSLIQAIEESTETMFFEELEDRLPSEIVEKFFNTIINGMSGTFSRESLDTLAQQIYQVEQYYTSPVKFNFYHTYPNWDTFRKDLASWMSTGKKTKCNGL